ncbi:hypothetical protein AFE_1196 [Acidithiobacillus ferrooxidans ATCC 23270]|uniref:Uncharacterized protein n=1 Tax=Acidithiobacillus ferrooxidans (strain ATCC 23270 / DSM 14882 / CIP 104768 / NCIMB 8455) TaxID=243159 RepID=B7J8M9_ACIF2|nr:hypothetical protein AFE_1196 [Acidithiobacillus ferrooxidans ATCC 23270]
MFILNSEKFNLGTLCGDCANVKTFFGIDCRACISEQMQTPGQIWYVL